MNSNVKVKKVAFIIPAYNESQVIGEVIDELKEKLKTTKYQSEIVVVNDASTDKTAQISKSKNITVITHIINSGSGSATATGLSYAYSNNFDIAATLDADGQHKPKDVLTGVELIQKDGGDLLIGSRLLDPKGMSKTKEVGNKGLSWFTYFIFGIKVSDSQSGLHIFSKLALEKLKWKSSGYEFCSEMLWRAKQQKLAIKEYPIETIYTEYSKSKGQNNWNSVNIVKNLLQRRIMEIFGE